MFINKPEYGEDDDLYNCETFFRTVYFVVHTGTSNCRASQILGFESFAQSKAICHDVIILLRQFPQIYYHFL